MNLSFCVHCEAVRWISSNTAVFKMHCRKQEWNVIRGFQTSRKPVGIWRPTTVHVHEKVTKVRKWKERPLLTSQWLHNQKHSCWTNTACSFQYHRFPWKAWTDMYLVSYKKVFALYKCKNNHSPTLWRYAWSYRTSGAQAKRIFWMPCMLTLEESVNTHACGLRGWGCVTIYIYIYFKKRISWRTLCLKAYSQR